MVQAGVLAVTDAEIDAEIERVHRSEAIAYALGMIALYVFGFIYLNDQFSLPLKPECYGLVTPVHSEIRYRSGCWGPARPRGLSSYLIW